MIVQDYVTDYGTSNRESFRLEPAAKGYVTRYLVIAGSIQGRPDAEDTYKRLLANAKTSESESAAYYRNYLRSTTSIEIPDKAIQQAYNWARVGVAQGIVQSPLLGTGLVAGYRISGDTARPGFAWFFGRDSEWTDLALTADGDYENTRQTLEFIMKFQREDGKVPHEISQTASLVDWFQNYSYGFASADATPLLIVAAEDYVTQSGDILFARQNWDHFWRAYQFVVSTYDEEGFAKNQDVGHGWVEGGPLLPVRSELYQAALAVQALRSLGRLAAVLGKEQVAHDLEEEFKTKTIALNRRFWVADKNIYGFGLDAGGKPVPVASVLATVPAWMGLLDADKANQMINVLAGEDHSTDWGDAPCFIHLRKVRPVRLPFWRRVALVHRMGCGRRIQVSSSPGGISEPPCQRSSHSQRRITGAYDRGVIGLLFRGSVTEFVASDLVGGDGDQSDFARNDGAVERCPSEHVNLRSAFACRLVFHRAS